jgi:DNA adenine methylase
MPEVEPARPFLKWAGGKSQLLDQFAALYPPALQAGRIARYVEPFVGGGAVFLDVIQRYPIREAYLLDVNRDLILAYQVIQRDPEALIERLGVYHDHYYSLDRDARERYFYDMRDAYNDMRDAYNDMRDAYNDMRDQAGPMPVPERRIRRVAHLIFLNKTCFNGLYRVNAKGEFNVPFGRYKKPAILDAENLRRLSTLLQDVTLICGDFRQCAPHVDDVSFVYFDPPYRPLNPTSSFTSYARNGFDDEDQIALGRFYARLDRQTGARLMLSNADPANVDPDDAFFEDLYAGYQIHRVYANRSINSKGGRRGKISELVITNY